MAHEYSKKNHPRLSIKISHLELLLIFLSLIFGLAVIFNANLDYPFNTSLLLIVITALGLSISKKTAIYLGDPKLNMLGSLWLFKVLTTIFLLYSGWMPELDYSTSRSWGYDPQRYYRYSVELIKNDWVPNFGLNYMGIVYYYAAIFYVIGYNPLIAALINIFVTLCGILFLIRNLYAFVPARSRKDWSISYLLIIPEVLWYDVMTSRETLLAILVLFVSLIVGRKIIAYKGETIDSWLVAGIFLLAILSVRTSMVIPVVFGAFFMFILSAKSGQSPSRRYSTLFVLLIGIIILFFAMPVIGIYLGSSEFNLSKNISAIFSSDENIASKIDGWSDRSIGVLLIPDNFFQAILFTPLRMILYLAAPLPNITVTLSGLLFGSYSAWQSLMTISTSLLMVSLFPYVLAGTSTAWDMRRKAPGLLVFSITLWINFFAVAGGNLIIHERYRLMFTILFFAVAWIGYTQSKSASVKHWAMLWSGSIFLLSVFYFFYKFF